MKLLSPLLGICAVLLMAGCASRQSPETQSLLSLLQGDLNTQQLDVAFKNLNPAYRYMRVELDGAAPALMVLGYVDRDAHGLVDVWYSALGEVIKTQNGRIVATVGLPVDWRAVTYASRPAAWSEAMVVPASHQRQRDELPAYRYGIRERVTLSELPLAASSSLAFEVPSNLRSQVTPGLRWFTEHIDAATGPHLPNAWFAVATYHGQEAVVFSRQCLSERVCLRMQLWPPEEGSP
jgi:hypothetical protein